MIWGQRQATQRDLTQSGTPPAEIGTPDLRAPRPTPDRSVRRALCPGLEAPWGLVFLRTARRLTERDSSLLLRWTLRQRRGIRGPEKHGGWRPFWLALSPNRSDGTSTLYTRTGPPRGLVEGSYDQPRLTGISGLTYHNGAVIAFGPTSTCPGRAIAVYPSTSERELFGR